MRTTACLLVTVAVAVAPGCIVPKNPSGGRAPSVRSVVHDEPPIPKVLVNQVGYLPLFPKLGTVVTDAATPLDWRIADAGGTTVAAGKTEVFGVDRASGDRVHLVDFSSLTKPGARYTLRVGADASHAFDIAVGRVSQAQIRRAGIFYQNRSGIDIAMPYAGDPLWVRPAGHLSDSSVSCASRTDCTYRLDVSGGWYDAGDHGKYVVNGGIALWTLLNLYERTVHLGGAVGEFADGRMNIPERGNGVPDLLDEARWEMEWMLKMQVPVGAPHAGMAHHKIHDRAWTTLALAPHNDTQPRFLQPPSTAATLNLAATAAQAARIWKGIDAAFAGRCSGGRRTSVGGGERQSQYLRSRWSDRGRRALRRSRRHRRILLGRGRAVHHDRERRLSRGGHRLGALRGHPHRSRPARASRASQRHDVAEDGGSGNDFPGGRPESARSRAARRAARPHPRRG